MKGLLDRTGEALATLLLDVDCRAQDGEGIEAYLGRVVGKLEAAASDGRFGQRTPAAWARAERNAKIAAALRSSKTMTEAAELVDVTRARVYQVAKQMGITDYRRGVFIRAAVMVPAICQGCGCEFQTRKSAPQKRCGKECPGRWEARVPEIMARRKAGESLRAIGESYGMEKHPAQRVHWILLKYAPGFKSEVAVARKRRLAEIWENETDRIAARRAAGETVASIAADYGISAGSVSRISREGLKRIAAARVAGQASCQEGDQHGA